MTGGGLRLYGGWDSRKIWGGGVAVGWVGGQSEDMDGMKRGREDKDGLIGKEKKRDDNAGNTGG